VQSYIPVVTALLITVGVVLAGLSLVAGVLVALWLAGNYSIDRLLAILGATTSTVGVVFAVAVYWRRWSSLSNRKDL
jgi:multisubunit Na+/H+ antiporter MnhF subunit